MSSSKKVKEKRLFIFRRSRQRFPIHFPLECCCSRPWIIQHVYIPFSLVIFADVVDGSSSKTTNNGEDERKVRYTIHSAIIILAFLSAHSNHSTSVLHNRKHLFSPFIPWRWDLLSCISGFPGDENRKELPTSAFTLRDMIFSLHSMKTNPFYYEWIEGSWIYIILFGFPFPKGYR